MMKRKPKPEPTPKMVMGVCGHEIEQERLESGRPWCTRRDCIAKHAPVVMTRTDWETGETWEEEAPPGDQAWLRETGP